MRNFIKLSLLLTTLAVSQVLAAARGLEWLDRGLVAMKTGSGVYLSWRILGTDPSSTSFNLYRDGTKIATIASTAPSNYQDASGTTSSTYTVRAVINGVEAAADAPAKVWANFYKAFPVTAPSTNSLPDGSAYTYNIADGSAGDLDGDGKLDIVMLWNPSNMKDNSLKGYTGDVWMDGYTLEGKRLFRIDLGKNIRAGCHYTQFQVADYDGDGKAEIMVKTAPGAKDGSGAYLSKGSALGAEHAKDYRNSSGYVLSGPEWLTVFRGTDGKEMATVDFIPQRGTVSSWGDSYGNRVDRFLAATAWLGNGTKPSGVFQRGYYTRMAVTAWDWDGTTLKQRWAYDAKTSGSECYGQGNHNLSVGDVDGDGYDEIIEGACAIDNDGKFMYRTGLGHGDAMHMGDLDPDHAGLEVYSVHEETNAKYGYEMHDAKTGAILWGVKTANDNGRGLAADVDSAQRGYESWSFASSVIQNAKGVDLAPSRGMINFRVYWYADLLDEILEYEKVQKLVNGKWSQILTLSDYGVHANDGNKYTPLLSADILGDWREEIVMGSTKMDSIKIFSSPHFTPHRLYTLWHDPVYRCGIAWQNSAYNQPPHLGFWLGAGTAKAPVPAITLVNAPSGSASNDAPVFSSGKSFSIPENTTAVVQCKAAGANGDAITYAIAGGEDSTKFTVDKTTGQLAFKMAPDYEKPVDNGVDNVYKVIVSASDGKASASQPIAILVTDIANESVAAGHRTTALVRARVRVVDTRGVIHIDEEQWLDPAMLRPELRGASRGMRIAWVQVDGQAPRRFVVPGVVR